MSETPDWSQLATKADLEQLATKADLKDLDQKFQGQMLGLQREMVELQRQMVSLKTDLQGQMLGIKSGLNWRLWLPVATSVVTTFTWAAGRPVTHSQVNSLWALVPVRLSS